VNTLGKLAENPRVIALRNFITGWHLSCLSAAAVHGNPKAGAEERLSPTGDNLPNVIQYLHEQHPQRLEQIFQALRRRIPCIEKVQAQVLADAVDRDDSLAAFTQLIVTTHSPLFIDSLRPQDVYVLYRAADGHTRARRAADIPGIQDLVRRGETLGNLWMDGYFDVDTNDWLASEDRACFERCVEYTDRSSP